ncbi:hypothetical protein PV11_08681 [Exophiala sideris]|uniref:Zn(2)-C6 fungal-type domain-containing protein n=1 Tax=Exophiala sideris TaxID=1016849 RepID=A0A0D1WNZ2_9EURO|nr:hypothetical protein PV11_08681 [Exophiala sideris]
MDISNDILPESSSSPPGNIPRKRRAPACERCNKRRVRCDASVVGFPCTECRRSNSNDCRLVRSKRTRGFDGRYVLPRQDEHQSSNSALNSGAGVIVDARSRHEEVPYVARTTQQPEISLDLGRLVDWYSNSIEERHTRVIKSREEHLVADSSTAAHQGTASFVGESWYASYVLSTSAAGHGELHQTIERTADDAQVREGTLNVQIDASDTGKGPPVDLPPQHLTERLLEAYFQRFHVFCPILERPSFLAAARDGSVSITLLRCVLFVASIHCEPDILHLMGYQTRLDAGDDLFWKACASFDANSGADRTTMVLSSYLLHYWFGKPTNYRDSLWWLATSIRSAQCMGYRRSTKHSNMSSRDKARFKVIWWCLYIRDRQVSLSTGTPMVINDLDHDVEDLTVDDFQEESAETARYMVAQASLNKTASSMYFRHCSPSRLVLGHDLATRSNARAEIQNALKSWYVSAPIPDHKVDHHYLTLILKVCYHYYIINLQQRLQRLCHRSHEDFDASRIILDAADDVSSLVEDSLLHWTPEYFPLIYVSAIFSSMTAHVAECSASKREQLVHKLRPSLLALKQFEQCYITARWIRNLFMDFLGSAKLRAGQRRKTLGTQNDVDHQNTAGGPLSANNEHEASSEPRNGVPESMTALCDESPYPVNGVQSQTQGDTSAPYLYNSGSYDFSVSPGDMSQTIMSNLFPNHATNDFVSLHQPGVSGMSTIDIPSPSTLDYQSLYFLADLGLPNFNGTNT